MRSATSNQPARTMIALRALCCMAVVASLTGLARGDDGADVGLLSVQGPRQDRPDLCVLGGRIVHRRLDHALGREAANR